MKPTPLLLLIGSTSHADAFTCFPRNCDPKQVGGNNCSRICLLPTATTARWSPRPGVLVPPIQARISGAFDNGESGKDAGDEDLKARLDKIKDEASNDSLQLEKLPSDEEDYRAKLAQAEKAIAEAEAARKKLLLTKQKSAKSFDIAGESTSTSSLAPYGCKSTISRTDAGSLIVTVPSSGFKSDSILAGVFSLVWFSAIIPATFAGGLGSALFLLPFWASGSMIAKLAFYDPFLGGQLTIGEYAWSLKGTWLGLKRKERDGATDDLRGAVAEVALWVNGVPQGELRLYGSKGMISLGLGLAMEELEYLAGEINQYLLDVRKGGNDGQNELYEGVL